MKNRSVLLPNKISSLSKACALSLIGPLVMAGCGGTGVLTLPTTPGPTVATVTPQTAIKHIVVIFGENISFDHYFGTYPNAANTDGTTFTAAAGTPIPSNYVSTPSLLSDNPNANINNNGVGSTNPFRLSPTQAGTGDQDHNYGPEQLAFDNGKMDLFPMSVGTADGSLAAATSAPAIANTTGLTMGYYDGNTVTAMWNYAQHYALNDHSYGTTFGASTQGAINLVSGQTNGVAPGYPIGAAGGVVPDGQGGFTLVGDEDPTGDICSSSSANVQMTGKNIGDLMNAASTPITWGFFAGGFNLQYANPTNHTSGCVAGEPNTSTTRSSAAVNIPGNPLKTDYIPHHEPFQYYASTANPQHLRPTTGVAIGAADAAGANHQYDVMDFNAALTASTPTMAQVSFLKAPGFQDGHAGYSDPLDEQTFVVNEVNMIEASPFWANTVIILAYDDSDGWYDHMHNLFNSSQVTGTDQAFCNGSAPTLAGVNTTKPVQGRCGYGPRLPLMVISPWARKNYIDTTVTDQSSITRFIEDIFLGSQRIGNGSSDTDAGSIMGMFNFTTTGGVAPNAANVQLNPTTGAVTSGN